jgi:hypothetical protein
MIVFAATVARLIRISVSVKEGVVSNPLSSDDVPPDS